MLRVPKGSGSLGGVGGPISAARKAELWRIRGRCGRGRQSIEFRRNVHVKTLCKGLHSLSDAKARTWFQG